MSRCRPRTLVNAIRFPSGDHTGKPACSPDGLVVSRCAGTKVPLLTSHKVLSCRYFFPSSLLEVAQSNVVSAGIFRVVAKTGTLLARVSALSGWVWRRQSGGWAEFSILSRGLAKQRAVALENALVRVIAEH
jgi:D-Ala-D-Ala carboxypeptidase 3 (S13) family